jgi:hypothetical protein
VTRNGSMSMFSTSACCTPPEVAGNGRLGADPDKQGFRRDDLQVDWEQS